MGMLLLIVGGCLFTVCHIWIVIQAFGKGILWGLLCLFFPPVELAFVIVHWEVANRPAKLYLIAAVLFSIGGWIHRTRLVRFVDAMDPPAIRLQLA